MAPAYTPGSYTELSHYFSLVSSHLQQFLHLSLSFVTSTVLKETGQLLCAKSSHLGALVPFHDQTGVVDFGEACLRGKVLLSLLGIRVRGTNMPNDWGGVGCDHLIMCFTKWSSVQGFF